jgi:hypothetical protein
MSAAHQINSEGYLVVPPERAVERILLLPVPLTGAVAPIDDEDGYDDDGDLVTRQ